MTDLSTPTRDRILDAAMRLFGERGYRGTSVAQIEQAAGLTPGAGGLYHHFPSKQALLQAGIERQLSRLGALRQLRWLINDLGDLRAELTVVARYVLTELDSEAELLAIMVAEVRNRPDELASAVQALIASSYQGLADWLCDRSDATLTPEQATTIAALGLGSLMASRLTGTVLGIAAFPVPDEVLIPAWVHTMTGLITSPPPIL